MPQRIEFEGTVHEFPDDFTDDDIAAALGGPSGGGQEGQSSRRVPDAMLPGVVSYGVAKALPGMVAAANQGAGIAGKVAASRLTRSAVPGMLALEVARDLGRGDVSGAARTAAGGAAVAAVPKVVKKVQQATRPAGGPAVRGALGRFVPNPGGAATRVAGAIAKYAGPIGLAVDTIFGEGAAGHRPVGETPEVTEARRRQYLADWQAMTAGKAK